MSDNPDTKKWDEFSTPPADWLDPVKEDAGEDIYSAFFKSLAPEDLALLVPLPYRIGLWMSEIDDRGGDEADEAEIRVLESIVFEIAEDFCKSQFIQIIMQWTLQNRAHWENWHSDLERAPHECEKVIWMLEQNKADAKDIESLRHTILYIAASVAMAFREEDIKPGFFESVKGNVTEMFGNNQIDHQKERLKNISGLERKALEYLSKYAGKDYKDVF